MNLPLFCCLARCQEQTSRVNRDNLPPLLDRIMIFDDVVLPEMISTSISTTYRNLDDYFAVFHPLMLLELWEEMTRAQSSRRLSTWNVTLLEFQATGPFFTIIKCLTACSRNDEMMPGDLVQLKLCSQGDYNFGIVETIVNREFKVLPKNLHDHEHYKRHSVTFNLRIRKDGEQMAQSLVDRSFTAKKCLSLNGFLHQLQAQALLSVSPVQKAIFNNDPSVFQLKSAHVQYCDQSLNLAQMQAINSITETIMTTPTSDSKICLLQGPPGKLFSS